MGDSVRLPDRAGKLGIGGTPAFVVGNQLLNGAVGYDALAKAIAAARTNRSG